MSNYRKDPTAAAAIGAVDAELKQMRRYARELARRRRAGTLTPREEALARRRFVGIYRRVLEEALG